MPKSFTIHSLKRFLEADKAAKVASVQPIVVNVDLSGLAKILAETPLKIRNGVTPLPS